jgi:aromatic-amino-acid transaminase
MSDSTHDAALSALIPSARDHMAQDPIFALNAQARSRAAEGVSVLNATMGVLLTDEGRLAVLPTVAEVLAAVPPERGAGYAPIAGPPDYLDAVEADALDSSGLDANAVAVATPGCSGAIHHAVVNFLEPGQAALVADFHWGPYGVITAHTGRRLVTFGMFDADLRFDAASFEKALSELIAAQGRALVLFNFPCNNPTGYDLTADEWGAVADIVARAGRDAPVAFLLDHAYAKFGREGADGWVAHVPVMMEHATVLIGWTVSKAYAQYGARVGALVALHPSANERARMAGAFSFSSRGTWSNCNHTGMLAATSLLTDPELRARTDAERSGLIELLDRRVEAFNTAAAAAGLRFPRYDGGFFVSVFTPDGERTAAAMREEGVFVIPLEGAVRVALCATPEADIPRLVGALARGVEAVAAG